MFEKLPLITSFEVTKLYVASPNQANVIILFALAFLCILTLRRGQKDYSLILDRLQSEQLRGLSIVLVVLGHLWVHVSAQKASFVFSGEAVAMFLMLSGFGLTRSLGVKRLDLFSFCFQRGRRVLIPYWWVTIIIFTTDYLILDRTYSLVDIAMTGIGLNITEVTRHIDYARWYITFQLFWYCLFSWGSIVFTGIRRVFFFFACGLLVFLVDYYFLHLGWYHFFSFPCGCLLAELYPELEKITQKKFLVLGGCVIMLILSIIFKLYADHLETSLPYICFKLMQEAEGVIFCLGLIAGINFFSRLNLKSYFLQSFGKVSYELYLLHGVFLIKYNPIISHTSSLCVSIDFLLLLFILFCLSLLLNRVLATVHNG